MCLVLLDSSVDKLAVGISRKDKLIDSTIYEAWQKQSEMMVYELDKLLKKHNISRQEIKGVIVTIGPGSYTGVRIALTIAKIISLALLVPIYPISSLEVLSETNRPSICLINARSNRSYFAVYENDKIIVKDCIKTNEQVLDYINNHKDYVICGQTNYLNVPGKEVNIIERMFALYKTIKPISNPDFVKPVYMKD